MQNAEGVTRNQVTAQVTHPARVRCWLPVDYLKLVAVGTLAIDHDMYGLGRTVFAGDTGGIRLCSGHFDGCAIGRDFIDVIG